MSREEETVIEESMEVGLYSKRGITLVRGRGSRVWDDSGREYIDCVGGHGVASVGHCNPRVAAAITRQVNTLITCPESFSNDVRTEYLARLRNVTPDGVDRFFLCNSGTEAVEAAIKFARLVTGRSRIVATRRGFHGRTMGALAATWGKGHRRGVEHLVGPCDHVSFEDPRELEEALDESTAALIIEVVQGEGGVHPAEREFVAEAARLCRERGVLFIADEIQTGFGRTGSWFAVDHYDVVPDMVCMAKAMAGGVPMGAVGLGDRVENLPAMSHGSTFGGNPLACAAALATLEEMQEGDLPGRSRVAGHRFMEGLGDLDSPLVREVRGMGLMVGVQMRVRVTPILRRLQERGVLALPAGATVLRFLPPLVIEDGDLDLVVDALGEALGEMVQT